MRGTKQNHTRSTRFENRLLMFKILTRSWAMNPVSQCVVPTSSAIRILQLFSSIG